MNQVRHNQEARRRQYALRERAGMLGFASVVVIDDDLGRSRSGSEERPGFTRLVAAVCKGTVEAAFAIAASRLARNSRDWHRLADLCALTETLVIDHDGVYDPRLLNDRLLLGLRGTISEFELGLIRQRSEEALRQMVARRKVLAYTAVGYVRTRDNRCEMTADRQVQEAIRGVSCRSREFGSVRQVLLWCRHEQLRLPTLEVGADGPEVVWKLPVCNRILSIVKDSLYAGAFAHGRRRTPTKIIDARAPKSSGHEVPLDQWQVLIRDHHPGYTSVPSGCSGRRAPRTLQLYELDRRGGRPHPRHVLMRQGSRGCAGQPGDRWPASDPRQPCERSGVKGGRH